MRVALFLSAALIAAPAYAQNNQYELRGVTAETEVEVGQAYDVGATSVASGNAATWVNTGADASVTSRQHMDGDARAETEATVWHSENFLAVAATAMANGMTAMTEGGDLDLTSEQLAHGDTEAVVRFRGGDAGHASTSASAAGNVLAASAENGDFRGVSQQESTGVVNADIQADHDVINGYGASGAIASANNISIAGSTSTTLTDTQQYAGGAVRAQTDFYVGLGNDVSGNATANANALTIDNEWGYVNSRAAQSSDANVEANAYVTLGGDFLGLASAGAYGVGNSVTASNVGSDMELDVMQSNGGGVSANAAMIGEGGEMALASSAAYGNSISAGLCNYCDTNTPSLGARSDQINDGAITSRASVNTPTARTVGASATAIGNAATYQSGGPAG